MPVTRVLIYPDQQALADAAGARLGLLISDAVALRGRADVVLTGGTVGIQLLESLAASPLATITDWTSVHVWWGDERFVPAGDADRNELQAQRALLGALPLPEDNIHRMGSADAFGTAEDAAAAYDALIAEHGSPHWDVALFGVGPDGHVASLFPGHPVFMAQGSASSSTNAVAVHDSPKPPPVRVSLTLNAINRARRVWLLGSGAPKAEVIAQALRSEGALPASAVHGTEETLWLLDAAAATAI